MLYSAEKRNDGSFRGKTWKLPTGLWRACNYKGQQCSFKLYNEAIRFAAKGKLQESKDYMKPAKTAEFIASWDGVPVHRLSPKQQEVLASIGNSMGATGGPYLDKKNLRGWNRLVAIDTIKKALRDASPEGRKLATPILKILQKDKGGLKEGLTRTQVWSQFKSEILPSIKKAHEQNGRPDKPARREAWNNYVDSLVKDGEVSEKAADGWGHPRGLETEGVLREGAAPQQLTGGKTVKTKRELKYHKSGRPGVVPAGVTVELKFSQKDPSIAWFQHGGEWRPTRLEVANASFTGIGKAPSMRALEKMGYDGVATTPTGKRVEPDGHSHDGSPSWLLVLGMI